MFEKSMFICGIIGVIVPFIIWCRNYILGQPDKDIFGYGAECFPFHLIGGGILGFLYFVTVPMYLSYITTMRILNILKQNVDNKNKIESRDIDDGGKQYRAIRATIPAQDVFNKIIQLKKSKFAPCTLLEQYEKELEQIILVVSNGEMYTDYNVPSSEGMYWVVHSNYTIRMKIPEASKEKFVQVVDEFKILVEHAESEIQRLEQEEQDRIDSQNNKALDEIHALLVSIKKDQMGE